MSYPLAFTAFDWEDSPSEGTPVDKEDLQFGETRLALFVTEYEHYWRHPFKTKAALEALKSPETAAGDVALVEEAHELYEYTGTEWVPINVTLGTGQVTEAKIAANAVTNSKVKEKSLEPNRLEESKLTSTQIKPEGIVGASIKKETLSGEKLENETITPKQLQGGAAPVYSGEIEVATEKEEEVSAITRNLVTLTIETEKSTKTIVEVLVNKVFAGKSSAGAAVTANSFLSMTVMVPAAQKYEVKVLEGKVNKVWASVVTV